MSHSDGHGDGQEPPPGPTPPPDLAAGGRPLTVRQIAGALNSIARDLDERPFESDDERATYAAELRRMGLLLRWWARQG
jgi:hypothetical protein